MRIPPRPFRKLTNCTMKLRSVGIVRPVSGTPLGVGARGAAVIPGLQFGSMAQPPQLYQLFHPPGDTPPCKGRAESGENWD